jgi:hypothetical protein
MVALHATLKQGSAAFSDRPSSTRTRVATSRQWSGEIPGPGSAGLEFPLAVFASAEDLDELHDSNVSSEYTTINMITKSLVIPISFLYNV